MFLREGILKICSEFTGDHPCRSVISIKLLRNFIEIRLRHRCSPVNLLHIFRTPFPKSECGKIRTRKTPNMDTFHALVYTIDFYSIFGKGLIHFEVVAGFYLFSWILFLDQTYGFISMLTLLAILFYHFYLHIISSGTQQCGDN